MNERYNVTVGLSAIKAEHPGYADFGLRYSNMKYDQLCQVEAIFNEHADVILAAMKPLRDALVQVGIEEIERRGSGDKEVRPPKR